MWLSRLYTAVYRQENQTVNGTDSMYTGAYDVSTLCVPPRQSQCYIFNVCLLEVFNTYIKMKCCVSQTQQRFIMIIIVLGRHVSILMSIEIQPYVTVCRYSFTAKPLYMFRVSQHPSSGVIKTVTAASGTGHNMNCTGGCGYSFYYS